MLDAYIIERIRHRQSPEEEGAGLPLWIEQPVDEYPRAREDIPPEEPQRGIVTIDFTI